MRRIGVLLMVIVGVLVAFPITFVAAARAAGGSSIATAPTVAFGQQEFGNTAEDQYTEESCGAGAWRSYWQLPVLAGDRVTINWEGTHGTRLILTPVGTTDFTYLNTDPAYYQDLSSNGKAQAQYTAPVTGEMPLSFRVCEYPEEVPGPYDFTATAQHALTAALSPGLTNVYRNSVVSGSAALADGSPAPDGLVFSLVAKWHNAGQLLQSVAMASTSGGQLAFQLALPAETTGKAVRLAITRGEDANFQAVKSVPATVHAWSPPTAPRHHKRHHHRRRHRHHHRR